MSKGLVLPTPPPANTPRVVDSSAYVDSSDSSFTVTTTNPNTTQLTQPPQQQQLPQPQQPQQQPLLVSTSFLMDSMQTASPLPATLAPPPLTPAPSLAEDTNTTRVSPFASSTPFPTGGFTGTSTALPPLGQQGAPFTLPSIVEFPIQPGFSLSYNNPPTMTPQPQQGTPSTIQQQDALNAPLSPFIKFSATPPATPQTVTSTNPNQNQLPPITTNDPSNPAPPGHDEVVVSASS